YQCCLGIGDEMVLTAPGNKVGPFKSALEERWDADTDQSANCYQEYTGNQNRVFLTPIVESFSVSGAKYVRIVKFAAFFLRERPGGDMVQNGVTGQFIKYIAPGEPGPPADTGIYGVHLVE
ncbi:MAG TPA: hypothetical protein VJX91_08930, partial [Candidatus Eisenbacteria bacterium]|nr:hypothetical protein [Candidatus Eisenbacteria bacterium]